MNFMPPVVMPGATVLRPRIAKPEPALAFTPQQFEEVESRASVLKAASTSSTVPMERERPAKES